MGYKEEKEAFVSNLTGTSMAEIALLSCLLPAGLFLRACLWDALGSVAVQRLPAGAIWLVEFATVGLPPLLSLVVPEQVPTMIFGAVLVGSGLSVLTAGATSAEQARIRRIELRAAALSASHKYHVAVFRATMMLTTCVCILAVDFKVFPRRFAKVETYGTGVMDIGVGAFVFANGLVSPAAKARNGLFGVVRSVGPLLVLGAGRLVSIKASGYPEHVTEYGVHWNFFLTLAAVAVCSSVAAPPASMGAVTAVILLCAHNYCLSIWPGWEDWVVAEDRNYTSLIDMNKEGIVSLPSYWAIYLLGQVAGRALLLAPAPVAATSSVSLTGNESLAPGGSTANREDYRNIGSGSRRGRLSPRPTAGNRRASRSPSVNRSVTERNQKRASACGLTSSMQVVAAWHSLSLQLAAIVGLLWLCTLLSVSEPPYGFGLRPSRRLLNGSYTCWLLAQCGSWLLSFLLLELHAPPVPLELERRGLDLVLAISGRLLPMFLVANIATGAVNLSINTLYVVDRDAVGILLLYLVLLCGGVVAVAKQSSRA